MLKPKVIRTLILDLPLLYIRFADVLVLSGFVPTSPLCQYFCLTSGQAVLVFGQALMPAGHLQLFHLEVFGWLLQGLSLLF